MANRTRSEGLSCSLKPLPLWGASPLSRSAAPGLGNACVRPPPRHPLGFQMLELNLGNPVTPVPHLPKPPRGCWTGAGSSFGAS